MKRLPFCLLGVCFLLGGLSLVPVTAQEFPPAADFPSGDNLHVVLVEDFRPGPNTDPGRTEMMASLVQSFLSLYADLVIIEEVDEGYSQVLLQDVDADLEEVRWRVTGEFIESSQRDDDNLPQEVRLSVSLVDSQTDMVVVALTAACPREEIFDRAMVLSEMLYSGLTAALRGSSRENVELLLLQGRHHEAVNRYLLGLGIETIQIDPALEDRLIEEMSRPLWMELQVMPEMQQDPWVRLLYTVLDPQAEKNSRELNRLAREARRQSLDKRLDALAQKSGERSIPLLERTLEMAREARTLPLEEGQLKRLQRIIQETREQLQKERIRLAQHSLGQKNFELAFYHLERALKEDPLNREALQLQGRAEEALRRARGRQDWRETRPQAWDAVVMPPRRLVFFPGTSGWADDDLRGLPSTQTLLAGLGYRRWYDWGTPLHGYWEAGGLYTSLSGGAAYLQGGAALRWYQFSFSLGGQQELALSPGDSFRFFSGTGLVLGGWWLFQEPFLVGLSLEESLIYEAGVGWGSRFRLLLQAALEW